MERNVNRTLMNTPTSSRRSCTIDVNASALCTRLCVWSDFICSYVYVFDRLLICSYVCLFVRTFVCLISLSPVRTFVFLFIRLCAWSVFHLFVRLCFCSYGCVLDRSFTSSYDCVFVRKCVCLIIFHLFVRLCIRPFVHWSFNPHGRRLHSSSVLVLIRSFGMWNS